MASRGATCGGRPHPLRLPARRLQRAPRGPSSLARVCAPQTPGVRSGRPAPAASPLALPRLLKDGGEMSPESAIAPRPFRLLRGPGSPRFPPSGLSRGRFPFLPGIVAPPPRWSSPGRSVAFCPRPPRSPLGLPTRAGCRMGLPSSRGRDCGLSGVKGTSVSLPPKRARYL